MQGTGMASLGQALAQMIKNKRNDEMNFKTTKAKVLGEIADKTGKASAWQAYNDSLSDLVGIKMPEFWLPDKEGSGSIAITPQGTPEMSTEDKVGLLSDTNVGQTGPSKPNLTEVPSKLGYAVNLPPGTQQYEPPQKDTPRYFIEQVKREWKVPPDIVAGEKHNAVLAEAQKRYAPIAAMREKVNNIEMAFGGMDKIGLPEIYKKTLALKVFGVSEQSPTFETERRIVEEDLKNNVPHEETLRKLYLLTHRTEQPSKPSAGLAKARQSEFRQWVNKYTQANDKVRQIEKRMNDLNDTAFLMNPELGKAQLESAKADLLRYENILNEKFPEEWTIAQKQQTGVKEVMESPFMKTPARSEKQSSTTAPSINPINELKIKAKSGDKKAQAYLQSKGVSW